jgi:hypothetical protein
MRADAAAKLAYSVCDRSVIPPSMPTPRDQRRRSRRDLKPDRVRALELLAGYGDEGCTKAILRAHGFATAEIVELVRGELATATAEHVVAGGGEHEVARVRITDAGRRVLAKATR